MIAKLNILISLVMAVFAGIWGYGRSKKKEGRADEQARFEREANEDLKNALQARDRARDAATGDGLRQDDGHRRN